jgi:hypothetical protein
MCPRSHRRIVTESIYPFNVSVIEPGLGFVLSASKFRGQIHPGLHRTVHPDFFPISHRPQNFPWPAQVDPTGEGGKCVGNSAQRSDFVGIRVRTTSSALACTPLRTVADVVREPTRGSTTLSPLPTGRVSGLVHPRVPPRLES